MLRGAELRERRRHRLAIVACKRVWSQPVSKRATREQPRVARGDGGGGGRGGRIVARTSQKRADRVLLLTKLALERAKIRLAAAR